MKKQITFAEMRAILSLTQAQACRRAGTLNGSGWHIPKRRTVPQKHFWLADVLLLKKKIKAAGGIEKYEQRIGKSAGNPRGLKWNT